MIQHYDTTQTCHKCGIHHDINDCFCDGLAASNCDDFFGDVPITDAMVGWTPRQRLGVNPKVGVPGRIVIIPKRDDGKDWFRYFGVTNSTGANCVSWREMTKKERLLKLYIEVWHIIARDGLSPKDVHAALTVIPEYRDSLSGETLFSWENERGQQP